MIDRRRKWLGDTPTHCQRCLRELGEVFIDGATKLGGPWAVQCVRCFTRTPRMTLGVGLGQAYSVKTLERLPDDIINILEKEQT